MGNLPYNPGRRYALKYAQVLQKSRVPVIKLSLPNPAQGYLRVKV
jgi:hypothetical protein